MTWRSLAEIDPFERPRVPTAQLAVMRQLYEGDRIIPTIGGKGFEFERTGASVPARTVDQLLHRAWLVTPEYPLLTTDRHAGRLTVRGQYALANCL